MADGKPFDLKRHLPSTAFIAVALILVSAAAGIFIYAGIYNIGADAPHWNLTYNVLDTLRERSISASARGIEVPKDLNDPKRIATGAGLYQEMCTGCHLGPGLEKSEMSQGLYPPAPELATAGRAHTPAQQFWIIKHGVKLSAMPAWGKSHNDELVWDLVAFTRQLPNMSPDKYKQVIASAPADHDEMMKDMPGMMSKKPDAANQGETPPAHAADGHAH